MRSIGVTTTSPYRKLQLRRLARRLFAPLVIALAVLSVLIEVTLWRWLAALGGWLGRLPLFAALERLVERLSPGAVIAIFVVPFVPLVPLLKLGELWLLHNHHYVTAVFLIMGTKIFGVAFSTRVFAIARPKMLQVPWFAKVYGALTWILDLGHRTLEGIPAWHAAHVFGRRIAQSVRNLFASGGRGALSRTWAVAVRWVRRRSS
ncbi:MAG: transrane protein [Rubritepida sp.]|nr:transrane protein [Rubritepida sp.]